LSGASAVTEGAPASYTVSLSGTLQAAQTASATLALANGSAADADHAAFAAAVTAAINSRTDLAFDEGTGVLTFTSTGAAMPPLVITLATVNDTLVEADETFTVSLSDAASPSGATVAGSGSITTTIHDNDTATCP